MLILFNHASFLNFYFVSSLALTAATLFPFLQFHIFNCQKINCSSENCDCGVVLKFMALVEIVVH
jgi:hypothetical protein